VIAAAAQASQDFTWPDVAAIAVFLAAMVAIMWLILRD
jgi:hypothetical protein